MSNFEIVFLDNNKSEIENSISEIYSYLKASTGSSLEAFLAG